MKTDFMWGSATAAYQCEGAWREGGKGLSNWDAFCHSEKNVVNPVTADVSCDHYHRYEEDIEMLLLAARTHTDSQSPGRASFPMASAQLARKALRSTTV